MAPAPVYNNEPYGEYNTNSVSRRRNESDTSGDIAIVGYSLRFPQEATSPDSFWQMLCERRCAMTDWPEDRLKSSSFRHPENARVDQQPVAGAHFMEGDPGAFDAGFFGITPVEAVAMDPQQRGLLETTYRALENAGIPMEDVYGSRTSVHTGCFAEDYRLLALKDLENLPKYAATGGAMTILANRLSWFFGLHGASMNIDTACSSSLTALDLACQGLRDGSADMGIVGGTNSLLGIEFFLTLGNMGFLSPDGRCYSFDSRANGYARGEGFGVVVMKRVADAIADGDTIRAVIRATGNNSDGRTPGITNPSQEAQAALIRETYRKAGLDLASTRYFEAHGTGTLVGDVIESNAIGGAFRKARSSNEPLYIGAVKSNIGHLEGASGVAGLIKTIMVLEKAVIPPNANFEKLNPNIDAEYLNLQYPKVLTPWPDSGLRRASINSFGFGGSNSHCVMDDAHNYMKLRGIKGNHVSAEVPPTSNDLRRALDNLSNGAQPNGSKKSDGSLTNGTSTVTSAVTTRPAFPPRSTSLAGTSFRLKKTRQMRVFPLSAADEAGVTRLVDAYASHFRKLNLQAHEEDVYLADLAYTLASRRSSLAWKATMIASSLDDLRKIDKSISRASRASQKLGIGYVFTGQGAQYFQMGRDLLHFDVFRNTLDLANDCLTDIGCEWSLIDELLKDKEASKINSPAYSQPLCTALQLALIELFQSWGVKPTAVVGHSSGEIAAAYAMGALSLESACKVAYFRGVHAGWLVANSKQSGAMMAVGLSEDQARSYIETLNTSNNHQDAKDLVVGCINSPKNVTVSGNESKIDELKKLLDTENVFARKLVTGVGYHSPQMEAVSAAYKTSMGDLSMGTPLTSSIKMASSVTGEIINAEELCNVDYWVQNMVSPVRFVAAITRMTSQSTSALKRKLNRSHHSAIVVHDLIEMGPHAALRGPAKEILANVSRGSEVSYGSVLTRNMSGMETSLDLISRLYRVGYPVTLPTVNDQHRGTKTQVSLLPNLPEYPFDHSTVYWCESHLSSNFRLRKHPRIDLLGTPTVDFNPSDAKWRKLTRVSETPWVQDHKINSTIIYPAAGMLVMAVEGIRQLTLEENHEIRGYKLTNVTFSTPLTIASDEETETELRIRQIRDANEKGSGKSDFRVYLRKDGEWTETCRGVVSVEYKDRKITEVDGGKQLRLKTADYQRKWEAAIANCSRPVEKKHMYEYLTKIGLDYGPAFQAMDNLHCSEDGEATAEVQVYKIPKNELANSAPIIHPVTVDAVAQLLFVALSRGTKDNLPTTIPTRITDCWISNEMQENPPAVLQARTRSSYKGYRNTESNIFALDKATGQPVMSIAKLESTTVSSESQGQETAETKQQCYHLTWQPDVAMMTNKQIQLACTEGRMAALCPDRMRSDLAFLMFVLMTTAYSNLLRSGNDVRDPVMRDFRQWMIAQIQSFADNKMEYSLPEWKALARDKEYQKRLLLKFAKQDGEAKWMIAVAHQLPLILQSAADVKTLAFPNPSSSDTAPLQKMAPEHPALINYMELLSHKNPGLNILEIGDSEDKLDDDLLEHFGLVDHADGHGASDGQHHIKYCYTHRATDVLESAKAKYPDASEDVEFRSLDIAQDVGPQGFEERSFDVVVINATLHRASDVSSIMRRLHGLLKPSGKLIIRNTVHNAFSAEFALRLLPECRTWWTTENKSRKFFVPAQDWKHTMSETKLFDNSFTLHDCHDIKSGFLGCLISTASAPEPESTISKKMGIVTVDPSQYHSRALQGLVSNIPDSTPVMLSLNDSKAIEEVPRAFYVFMLESDYPILPSLQGYMFKRLKSILASATGVLWVTNGGGSSAEEPGYHMIDGLARTLRSENPNVPFVTLALEGDRTDEQRITTISRILKATLASSIDNYEAEYCEVEGILHTGRMVEAPEIKEDVYDKTRPSHRKIQTIGQSPPLTMTIGSVGLLDTLQFVQDKTYEAPLEPGEVEIEVKATGLNFMDCLVALGRIAENTLGSECAGVVTRAGANTNFEPGDRVCAVVLDCFKTYARADARAVARLPDSMSFAEAAAIPIQFITAYYALAKLAHLSEGETVLIHSATGGTGQAAVQVAQHLGAEVYVTVGSDKKKELIMKEYNIPEDHVFFSRNLSFADGIKRMTNGVGVDVVLNSLNGDGLRASWESIAPFGRFVEIGKFDIHNHKELPMNPFMDNCSFHAFDLVSMRKHRPDLIKKSLHAVLQMFASKALRPAQPLNVYTIGKVEDAFRYMQSGVNVGKTVVEMVKEDKVMTVLENQPTWMFDAHATYAIAGGFGGLGRSMSRWMVSRGARNLLLLSRSGAKSQEAKELVEELSAKGVKILATPCDISSARSLATVVEECRLTMPPIKGCFQATMVLRDVLFENMTYADWTTSITPKVAGSWNLHSLLPNDLDFFVLLSSIAGVLGTGGQGNYAAGNAYMDTLAQHRISRGQKAISLDLGWMDGEGVVAENEMLRKGFLAAGYLTPVTQTDLYALLDHYCDPRLPLLSMGQQQMVIGVEPPSTLHAKGIDLTYWMQRSTFRALHQLGTSTTATASSDGQNESYNELLNNTSTLAEGGTIVLHTLTTKLSRALSVPYEDLDAAKPLHAYGVDSLLAVELRNWFQKEWAADVAIFDIMGAPSLSAVGISVAGKSGWKKGGWK